MDSSDKPRFANLIQALAGNYNIEPTAPMLEGYWIGLRSLPFDALERAVEKALGSSKRMPVAAELRELAGEMTPAIEAVHAWAAVKRAIREHGMYRSMDFGAAGNAAVRALGGWQRLCATESEELDKWTRKDFERIYSAFISSGASKEEGTYLAGIHEETNRMGGYKIAPPVRVALIPGQQPETRLLPEKNN